ncbi:MAG: hypothetical protein Q9216_005081 [Gyalolechia sp. 2 TL-2023]
MKDRTLTPAKLATNHLIEIQKLLRIHKSISAADIQVPELTEMICQKITSIDDQVTEADFAGDHPLFLSRLTGIRTTLRELVALKQCQDGGPVHKVRIYESISEQNPQTDLVSDWSVPVRRYTAGPKVLFCERNSLRFVCRVQDPLLYDLHWVSSEGEKDPLCRFRATDILHMDVCSDFNRIHLELKCGELMFRDIFIDLPIHLKIHETGDFRKFLKKLLVMDGTGLQVCEIYR